MPPINHAALSVGVIAVSVVVAAGIAIYESPELRRIAEDLRRRIAVALHSLGDSITPQERENLFNRPEDAEGFLLSRGIDVRQGDEQGVDADEETRRRQREELMYWNAIAESKRDQEKKDPEKAEVEPRRTASRGSSFDDFLQRDATNEKGAFVFNSGTDVQGAENDGLRRRGDGARGLNYSVYTNPFADEHGIDEHVALENSLVEPERDDLDDIYSVSHNGRENRDRETTATLSAPPEHVPSPLVEIDTPFRQPVPAPSSTSERELGQDEYMTAGQEDRHDAYSSIQAWAQTSNTGFYSPLPVSPAGPMSEPELISEGQLTPTDSASLAGSGEDVGGEANSSTGEQSRYYDVLSDDEGIMTPASWTEVGSVISESDAGVHPAHAS
ncbi:hypothetical protein SCUP234_01543 [Seiridium cupressi]